KASGLLRCTYISLVKLPYLPRTARRTKGVAVPGLCCCGYLGLPRALPSPLWTTNPTQHQPVSQPKRQSGSARSDGRGSIKPLVRPYRHTLPTPLGDRVLPLPRSQTLGVV